MKKIKIMCVAGSFLIALFGASMLAAQERGAGIINPSPIDLSIINRPISLESKIEFLPLRLRQVRQRQIDLSERDGIKINIIDNEARSQSALGQVPIEFQNIVVDDELDIQFIAEEVGKYYGMGDGEELRFNHTATTDFTVQYHYQQYISDIPTDNRMIVDVDKSSLEILRFRGTLDINRDYPTVHALSAESAFQQVLAQMRREGVPLQGNEDYEATSRYSVIGEVSKLDLVWSIDVISADGSFKGAYFVTQDGSVITDSYLTYSEFRLCDGRGTVTLDCDDVPIVIDETGACAGGIYGSCTGAAGDAYYEAKALEEMLEDIVGGPIDLGTPNSAHGGMVDIMIVDASNTYLGGATAGYAHGASQGLATILIAGAYATDPGAPWHEMGHAAQATFSPNTYYLPTGAMTTQQKVEHMAVIEFIGEMAELAKRNYNGPSASPKYDSSPTWTSRYGENYSSSFEHSNMVIVDDDTTPYENARVGGHAMYELVNAVGYEEAMRAFAGAVNNLDDDNSSTAVSWQEFRNSMSFWAVLNGGGTTLNAVMDAWHGVGVGDSSTGAHNPPTDYDLGSPPIPAVSVSLTASCNANFETIYDLYHPSSGASFFRIFWSSNAAGPYIFSGQSTTNPTSVYTVGNNYMRVQACAANSCSLMSAPVALTYHC